MKTVWRTDNGVPITPGLRVFTNDWEWGTVLPDTFESDSSCNGVNGEYFDGWFRVRLDSMSEGGYRIYNGERMTTSEMHARDPRKQR